ncbi:EXS-domain-containing protein [Obba rivulosa]|uniref:EXS-domain-containing protein n=1 Tax=Obba rivulosa TaxID=1052685 RepID=A0A8E2ARM9_9APHY|nr:EXS-domain-containing protein [Obba rivulosa]
MLDPLPILFRPSRWWLVRNIGRLLTSGVRRVEFADFWMGDQFCSLIFTLSNLYFVVCTYGHGLDDTWRHCTGGTNWSIAFVLASLPLLVRLVQSIKRWVDSRLVTHLINGGKYGSGIIYYLFYYLWRAHGAARGGFFVLWCIFGVNYTIYASSWDILMDWSLLRPHARYPLLRSEVLYTGYIPFYYFAIVSNVLLRFIWVLYIPEKGPDFVLRTFIAGMLEMLRRLQWNFYRLENEHLGNMDQYRVTREVPLPYSLNDANDSDGGDEDDDDQGRMSISSMSSQWRRRQSVHSKPNGEHAQEAMT